MAASLVTGAVGLSKSIGFDPIKAVGNIFGGGAKCGDSDIQEAEQIAADLQEYTTRQDRINFLRSIGPKAEQIGASPKQMAGFFVGGIERWGGDCKHKNVGSQHQQFLNQLKSFISRKKSQKQTVSSASNQQKYVASGGGNSAAKNKAGLGSSLNLKTIVFAAVALILGYLIQQ